MSARGSPTRSVRRRVLQRAARAWSDGYPYRAMSILAEAGMSDHWPEFRDQELAEARRTFLVRMAR